MHHANIVNDWDSWLDTAKATGADLVLLKAGHKGPHYDDWQNTQLSMATLWDWAKQGQDAGLKCARFPTLDVDCDNQEVGGKVREFLSSKNLDGYLDRKRDAKGVYRFAAIFRTEEPAPKQARTYRFTDTGETFKLEFLGDGQQVKVLGTHDTPTGGRYFIEGGPRDLATLPEIGGADHRKLILDELEALLIAAFPTLERKSSSSGQVGARRHKKAASPADLDPNNQTWDERRVRELVAALPANDFEDYDEAFKVCAAIWGSTGGADFGLELWREWAQGGSWGADNDDAWVEKRWSSLTETTSALKELRGLVVQYGHETGNKKASYVAARDTFAALEQTPGMSIDEVLAEQGIECGGTKEEIVRMCSVPSRDEITADPLKAATKWPTASRPKLRECGSLTNALSGMVFRVEDATLYERATLVPQGGRGWQTAAAVLKAQFGHAPELDYTVPGKKDTDPPIAKKQPLHDYLSSHPSILRVDTFGYFPGMPELYYDDGRRLVLNQWRCPEVTKTAVIATRRGELVADDDALAKSLFGQLAHVLFECMASTDSNWEDFWNLYLDWSAVVVAAPSVKPGHHYLFTGGQGIGKSLLADIIARFVGYANKQDVSADTLSSGFQDFLKARFITVDELYVLSGGKTRTGHSAYNAMKSFMAKTPQELNLNIKTKPKETAANLSAWQLSTNSTAHDLGLDHDDRRIAVVACESMTKEQKTKAQQVCDQLGELKDQGFSKTWDQEMAEAFAARLAAVMADTARWKAVLGSPPRSNAKVAIITESISPLASHIKTCWEEGRLPDVTSQNELVETCASQWNKPAPHIQNALSSPKAVKDALKELGAVTKQKVRVYTHKDSKITQQRTLVAFPTVLTELRDDVSAAEQQQALDNWQEAWSDKNTSDWRACYESCRDAFEGPD